MQDASEVRKQLHLKSFKYSTEQFPFLDKIKDLFGCDPSQLHHFLGSYDVFKRSNDQSTLAHKTFYANFLRDFKSIYVDFVHEVVRPIIHPFRFYYQVIPTFRVGLPGNKFVGEYHKDSMYHHQSYEINFNLGISGYEGDAALKSERKPDSNDFVLVECPYGTIFSFDHIDCLHGSDINTSNKTMLSFDFRCALADLYFESNAQSVNKGVSFAPGKYFSPEAI